jgi:hypothetical protein
MHSIYNRYAFLPMLPFARQTLLIASSLIFVFRLCEKKWSSIIVLS